MKYESESYFWGETPWLLVGMKSDQRDYSEYKDIVVTKEEAIELAKEFGQCTYKLIFYKLQHFITGAFGYYECSSLEGTGLIDIIEAIVINACDNHLSSLDDIIKPTPEYKSAQSQKRYHMISRVNNLT